MATYEYGKSPEPSDGERVLHILRLLAGGWRRGEHTCPPRLMSPWVAASMVDVTPELVVENECGWNAHFPGEVLTMDTAGGGDPWQLLSYADWAFAEDCGDIVRDLDDSAE